MATSREPLGIGGEHIYQVPTLSLPVTLDLPMQQVMEHEATRLFVERALAVRSSFALDTQNATVIAQICQRLDGIPLAIELAAARVRVLSPQEIAARLDDRFSLLTEGSHTALPRHQTLRATIDWSYNLLTAPERLLFRRLAVFTGGFTFDAARWVCTGEGVEPAKVLDLLSHLVDKSLVGTIEQDAETRYRFLETLREYALDLFVASGEATTVRDRHLLFFKHLAQQIEPQSFDGRAVWMNRLQPDLENIRAALHWSMQVQTDEPHSAAFERTQAGLELGAALAWFMTTCSPQDSTLLKQLLATPTAAPRTIARAKALNTAGFLGWALFQLDEAQVLL